jgi:hypothetical protein
LIHLPPWAAIRAFCLKTYDGKPITTGIDYVNLKNRDGWRSWATRDEGSVRNKAVYLALGSQRDGTKDALDSGSNKLKEPNSGLR